MASYLNPLLCFLILFLPSTCVLAETRRNNITAVDYFIAGEGNNSWVVSPSGDFAFGFQPHKNNSFFLLSIWYANILNTTIVWYANGDNPAPKGSRVEVTPAEGLKLTNPDGGTLWTPENRPSGIVASGGLNDFGNFILRDGRSNSVWETFKNPKDTMLPSQILENGEKLSSRKSEVDFAQGRFQLVLKDDGNLVMHSVNLPSEYVNENYFESKTVESNTSSPGTQLVFDKSGDFYVLRENNKTYNFSDQTISSTQYYLRATLNFDGVFTFYQHPKSSSGTWTPIWSEPDNICSVRISEGTGICGYNSICRLGGNSRPTCTCPPRYSLLDPDDPYGSCKPDFIQGCEEDELSQGKDLYHFEELLDHDWPLSDYVLLKPFTEDKCKQACLEDCFCAVAIFRAGDSCWKKRFPLSNGMVDTGLKGGKALIKVRKDNSSLIGPPGPSGPPIIERKNRDALILVVSVLLGSSAFLSLVLIGTCCLGFSSFYQLQKKLKNVYRSDSAVETNLRCFTYKELEEATNGFKEELGRGAFAVVCKGTINMGSAVTVAVKRLNTFPLQETDKEFKNEVNIIGQTHHKNLVRLLGFCEEGTERMLVYEYMSNGTLASLLFSDSKPNWNLRLKLAFGIARGLVYLHEDCGTQIIHCDIKPQNILLDDYFNARISDFGLSKLLNMNQSRTHTAIRGTKGYVALEWFKNMPITSKVDVYSFGVLLLEIICCRKSVDMEPENEERAILTDWAYDCYTTGTIKALVEQDQEALNDQNLEKLVMIALWCTQEDPTVRPTMRKVSQMLEGVSEVPSPPCQFLNSMTQDHYYSVHLDD